MIRRLLPVLGRRSGWRLVSAQLLLALLVALMTWAAVVSYDGMVSHDADRQMQNTADLAEVFVNQQNAGVAAVITSAMKAGDVSAALAAPDSPSSKQVIARTLAIISASGTDISSVVITSADGKVISSLPARVAPGYDLSQRLWFQQARRSSTSSISAVFKSAIVKDLYLTTISVPVRLNRQSGGTFLGVVSVAEALGGYQRFVDAYAHSRNIRLSVIDGAGAVVAEGGTSTFSDETSIPGRIALGRQLLSADNSQITAVSAGNSGSANAAATGENWRVVSQMSRAIALRPAAFFRAIAVIGAGLILLATFLLTRIRRRAARARRDAARHLEQSRSRMSDLANSSPDVLFRLAPDGTVIFSSQASAKVLGRASDEVLGQNLIPLLETELAPPARVRLASLIRTGEPQVFTARISDATGLRRIVECSMRLGLIDDVTEVWGALRDVTDRRSAADQVEQLFQLSEDFMAVVDFEGLLVQVNPVWTAAFEVGSGGLLGTRFEGRFRPEDHDRVAAELTRLALETTVATFETRYQRDDVVRTLLWTAAPDPGRRLIYAVGRDITDHKELQRALAETRDEALEASRLKSEFVATMSHEIRTPMNGVIGLTDLLLGTRLDATQRRYVGGIRTAGDALLSVINDILDFSKIEAGRMVLDNVDFRLEDVVDDVVTLVRQAAGAKGLELTVEYQSGVPFALNGDPGRLRQILLNLAHNAVKFTADGGVSVRVEPGPVRPDGEVSVIFKVTDTGIGIEPTRLEELFEPFRQADEGVTRAYGGTGLGLSICRRLADLMGGSIQASSELGRGATFSAELVFSPAADWGRSVRGRDARGLAVLVVDDNEVNRLVMITQLTRWGMRPVEAASAEEAMDLLTQRSAPAGGYDLAVIDMHMPQISGFALVRQLRAVPALVKLPVIMLTSDQTVDHVTALEHGISARLTKPVQQSALFDALTRVGLPNGPSAVVAEPEPGSGSRPGVESGSPSSASGAGPALTPASEQPLGAQPSASSAVRDQAFRLLLVEDNDINQTVALGILTQLGYQVDVAGDGIQAVTMAGQQDYDAILMDCQMPRMDGYAATVELRQKPATARTPIIAMTAATFAADRQRCFDSGMDDFIAKPVRAATLQGTLNRWLRPDPDGAAAGSEQAGAGLVQPPAGWAIPAQIGPADSADATGYAEYDGYGGPDFAGFAPDEPGIGTAAAGDPSIASTQERIAELLGEGTQVEVDLVRDIVASFLSRTVDLLQRLTLAVAADDAESAFLHAHSLAGAALNLGTVRVVQISRQIETDARAGRPGMSVDRLVELEIALDQARVHLRDLAAALPDPAPAPAPVNPS